MKCKQCGNEYEAKRSTSAYCGPKCKQAFYRNRMSKDSVTPVTVTPKSNVTVTPDWMLTQEQIDNLPLGVVKPMEHEGQPSNKWHLSERYMKTLHRLLTHTVAELETMNVWIPSWKYNEEGLIGCNKKRVDKAEGAAGSVALAERKKE